MRNRRIPDNVKGLRDASRRILLFGIDFGAPERTGVSRSVRLLAR
jgi:hypothetical protein